MAAIEARRYWSPLEAASRPGEPLVQTLAAEFYGTPFSLVLGPPPGLVGTATAVVARIAARKSMGCRLIAGETIGLGPVESRVRMSTLPLRISKATRSYAAHHKTGEWYELGKFCNRATSKLLLVGPDDAIVATRAARLDDSKNPNLGGENFEAYCHGKKGFWFKYEFSGNAPPIYSEMCDSSFFESVGACGQDDPLEPDDEDSEKDEE